MLGHRSVLLGCLLLLAGCATSEDVDFVAGDSYEGEGRPWSHLNFDNDAEDFQFVIVTDRTGGHRPGVFAHIMKKVDLMQPELVMSVGDYVEGYTEDESEIALQWQEIDDIIAGIEAPFFYVPGNHDHGNTQMARAWRERKGRSYYHFVYRDVLFIALHTEDPPPPRTPESEAAYQEMFGLLHAGRTVEARDFLLQSDPLQPSMGQMSDEQTDYIVDAIERNDQVRWTFVFMHRPMFNRKPGSNFTRVEQALAGRNYTMFAGHQHLYRYLRKHGQDHMQLGTTGGGWNSAAMTEVNRDGDGLSEMDHITWVTMRDAEDGGPSFAHIVASGIFAKDEVPDFVPGAEFCGEQYDIECVYSSAP